jgi:N-acetylglucosamine kinase-like BadF-type ATPase
MKLYLGIDGGQSHTTALIADGRGRILGRGGAGPSNHTREPGGRERLIGAVTGSIGGAAAMAGLNPARLSFASAHLALTGEPEEKIAIVNEIVRAKHLVVGHDAPGALAGALAGATGIIVLAGTGSVACGEALVPTAGDRTVSRRFVRVGGHGYLFSDEGSAFGIAREALRHALRNEDAGEPDDLKPLLLGYFGNANLKAIAQDCYAGDLTRERLASFASVLGRHAARHAGAAREILDQAAGELATLAVVTAHRLAVEAGPLKISYGGGVFRNRRLLKIFEREVTKTLADAVISPPRFGPDIGALLLAYRGVGINATPAMLERLTETSVKS